MRILLMLFLGIFIVSSDAYGQGKSILTVKGRDFELNGEKFEFTGVSFFNAIYNPEFNRDSQTRREWIRKFKDSGINVLRVWCQWDNERGFVDSGNDQTIFNPDGTLVPENLSRLKDILRDADTEGTIILLVLFSRESWNENIRLSDDTSDKAVAELTKSLIPFRNLILQVWNEFNYRTLDYYRIIKYVDSERIVTNSPGYAGELGSNIENQTIDYLSPHTTRNDNSHWEVAVKEIEYLIEKFNKPVVDDEPARKGTPLYGGPKSPVIPTDHIIHIYNVWKAGGYVIYHHDMFQTGSGSAAVPPNGIPAPGFSDYHDQVFAFLKNKERYLSLIR
ncbi:MAG TPA: cellulase family glycosylhydrolase [Bacteroidales bacterium]|nr:cellulase family glycosylhydrolase [Bacteroidales bacterium]